jgi:hypothetical protein
MTLVRFFRSSFLGIATLLFISSSASAWTYDLTDGNSTVTIKADSSYGMKNWTVDGQDQLYQQWFWYRVGSRGGEKGLNQLSLVSADQTSDSTLTTLYQKHGKFSIEVSYSLTGGAAGSGMSSVNENIKITNLSNDALDFHFFQYVDFDLGGFHRGDTVQLGQNELGLFDSAYQYRGNTYFADEVVTPGANHAQAGKNPSLFNKLARNNSPTTLNDRLGPLTGDASWAFQWDPSIPVGGSFSIDIKKSVSITSVPEPTALALVPVALALFGVVRRRRS